MLLYFYYTRLLKNYLKKLLDQFIHGVLQENDANRLEKRYSSQQEHFELALTHKSRTSRNVTTFLVI